MNFSGSPKGTPTTGVIELFKKKLFCNENQEFGGDPQKNLFICSLGTYILCM